MGNVRCVGCGRQRSKGDTCPVCGSPRCYVAIWWRKKGDPKGKQWKFRHMQDMFFLDYARAEALLGRIRTDIASGRFNPEDYTTGRVVERRFDSKADAWLTLKKKEKDRDIIRPSSYGNIAGHLANHLVPYFAAYDVREINKEDLANFRDHLSPDLSPKTRKNIFVTLHSFFSWLWQDIGCPVPPFPPLEADDPAERGSLDIDEQLRLLRKIPEGVQRDMLEFAMEQGIRPGELVALKVKDVDLTRMTLHVRRTVSAYSHVLEGTKGRRHGNSRRKKTLRPLSDRAAEIAKGHCRGRFGDDWLFVCPATGTRWSVKAPNRIWRKYTGSDLVFYEASRHSFLTQLSDAGVEALDLKDLAGHSDIRTTQKYVHKRTEHLREKINIRRVVPLRPASEEDK